MSDEAGEVGPVPGGVGAESAGAVGAVPGGVGAVGAVPGGVDGRRAEGGRGLAEGGDAEGRRGANGRGAGGRAEGGDVDGRRAEGGGGRAESVDAEARAERPGTTPRGVSRRSLLAGGAGLLVGAAAASGAFLVAERAGGTEGGEPPASGGSPTGAPVAAHGDDQAGVVRPVVAQAHALISVFDAPGVTAATLSAWLRGLGESIAELTSARAGSRALPDGAGDLTVLVGIGPRLLALRDRAAASATTLPAFVSDAEVAHHGGDVLLMAAASDPFVPAAAIDELADGLTLRWEQPGFRGGLRGGATRNPFGYFDGIIVPDTPELLDAGVWIADGPLAGGTICAVRRFRLDVDRFRGLSADGQDAVFGRRHADGQPLSGGDAFGEIDLLAKTPEGEYRVPARAHARAAHPSFIGAPLMHRRSYSYADSDDDRGIVFLSFQNDIATFSRTLQRLEETDDLLDYATATTSAAFAILPGFTPDRPLGSTLPG